MRKGSRSFLPAASEFVQLRSPPMPNNKRRTGEMHPQCYTIDNNHLSRIAQRQGLSHQGRSSELKNGLPLFAVTAPLPGTSQIVGVAQRGLLIAEPQALAQCVAGTAWRNINLIGKFDVTTRSTPVDIEALAARYQNQDFWDRSMTEAEGDGPPM
ncbi:MAG: Tn3 family transposase [Edaphobacter sp.]|nr:Tn3 family transposase [Edaphobacter sp.]